MIKQYLSDCVEEMTKKLALEGESDGMTPLGRRMNELNNVVQRLSDRVDKLEKVFATLRPPPRSNPMNRVKPTNVNSTGKAQGDKNVQATNDTAIVIDEDLDDRMSSNCPE